MTSGFQEKRIYLPTTHSKLLLYIAKVAKFGSYALPAIATILLFLAVNNEIWFWCSIIVLIASIILQAVKDSWEKILKERRRPDARELDIALAHFALTSANLMTSVTAKEKAVQLSRQHLMQALGREYEEWPGFRASLYLLPASSNVLNVSVEIGDDSGVEKHDLNKVFDTGSNETQFSENNFLKSRTFIAVPIRFNEEIHGIVTLESSEKNSLTGEDVGIAKKYAALLSTTFVL